MARKEEHKKANADVNKFVGDIRIKSAPKSKPAPKPTKKATK